MLDKVSCSVVENTPIRSYIPQLNETIGKKVVCEIHLCACNIVVRTIEVDLGAISGHVHGGSTKGSKAKLLASGGLANGRLNIIRL